jgi:Flp pilus assembly protein CpaB
MPLMSVRETDRPAAAVPLPRSPKRPLLSRLSPAHGLMAGSGLLAFFLVLGVTSRPETRLTVAVARADIPAGAALSPAVVRSAEVPADGTVAQATVPFDRLARRGQVAARPIAAGELLRPSDIGRGGSPSGTRFRAMSIPVKRERAVGGTLRVGDRVDVVDVIDGTARWVVVGAQVIDVPRTTSSRGIVREAGGEYHVVVEVDRKEALALAEALSRDTVQVVRSTGAPIPDAQSSATAVDAS